MKDIDKLLNEHPLRPLHSLSDNFTSSIITELKANANGRKWGILHLLRKKIGILSLGLLLVAGGTAAALTLWPTPAVHKTATKQLPSGDHVVGYDVHDCQYFSTKTHIDEKADEYVYYEVKQGSKLTDAQLRSSLEGVCEENVSNNAVQNIAQSFENGPQAPKGGFSTGALIVTNITSTSITVGVDPIYGPAVYRPPHDLTYNQFFNGLKVYDENTPIAYNSIKVGDTIKMYLNDTRGYQGYAIPGPDGIQPETDPTYNVVYAIIKIPPLTADPSTFYSSVARDIVRVDPCATSPTGYCLAYDFDN